MSSDKLQFKYTPLSEFKRWGRNPKEHDIGTLHQSVDRFGFNDPICVNLRTGTIIEGHGRIDTLQQWKTSGKQPPKRIIQKDDQWLVPTIFVDMDEKEAEAYSVAHNRITLIGGWDDAGLAEVLSDLAADDLLDGVGYDVDDLDAMLKNLDPISGIPDPDKTPETKMETCPKCGHQWEV